MRAYAHRDTDFDQIDVGKPIGGVERFRNDGSRLVQINCTKTGYTYEINNSFDKAYRFENLRITVTADTEILSISGLYWSTFIYENERHDLLGMPVKGMNIDFKGPLFRTAVRYPFSLAPAAPAKSEKPR